MEQPEKKKKTITIEVWDCGIENHNHKTYNAALNCMIKHSKKTNKTNPPNYDRDLRICERYQETQNYTQVSREFGISPDRVKQVIMQANAKREREQIIKKACQYHIERGTIFDPQEGLSIDNAGLHNRLINSLKMYRVFNMHQLREQYLNGSLQSMKGLGEKGLKEISEWIEYFEQAEGISSSSNL